MSGSLANRDEALRCAEMAEAVAQSGNLPKAIRLFEKAFSMYPDPSIAKRLKAAQDSMASPNNPSSSSSSSSSSSRANPGGPQPAPSSSSSSSSTAQPAPRQRTGGQGAAAAAAASAAPPHTPQQKAAVVRVIQAKTHYEVLEVTKEEADDANLKKAYRKLALLLHPDKNTAPRADEAFRRVSEAFNVLSDPARRSTYDQFGTDDPQEHMARRAGGGMRDPTPEEFFAQFFGGAAFAGGGGPGVYHHNPFFGGYTQQRGYARPRRAERAEQAPNLLQQFMQLLPLILLFAFAIFGGGSSGDDGNGIFSLTQQGSLSVRKVSDNGIPFFVSPAFDNQYSQSSKRKVAYEAERLAKRESFYACQNEIRVREAAVARAKGERNPNQKDIAKAEKYPTPNCDTYHKLRRAHND